MRDTRFRMRAEVTKGGEEEEDDDDDEEDEDEIVAVGKAFGSSAPFFRQVFFRLALFPSIYSD